MRHVEDNPGMAIDLHEANLNEFDSHIYVTRVNDVGKLQKWIKGFAEGYSASKAICNAVFEIYKELEFDISGPLHHYVGVVRGNPVATASLFFDSRVAGILNVSTTPKLRRTGLGTAMTLECLRQARDAGYRTGVLISSKMGLNVYKHLGFRQYCLFKQYVCFSSPQHFESDIYFG